MTDLNKDIGNNIPNVNGIAFGKNKKSKAETQEEENTSNKTIDLDSLNCNPAALNGLSMVKRTPRRKKVATDEQTVQKSIRKSLEEFNKHPKEVAAATQLYDLMLSRGYNEEQASGAADILYEEILKYNN